MKKLKLGLLVTLGGLLAITISSPARALENTSVRRLTVSEATGQSGQPASIQLAPGQGVNLSFIPTGEIVEKVWFDNPAIATLDADGCLVAAGIQAGEDSQQCQSDTTVLHLRQINQLNIPGLPRSRTALLTAVTTGAQGRRVYLFRVVPAQSSQYNTVEIVPDSIPGTDWQVFNRGLLFAAQRNWIRPNQPLWQRIQNFLTRVRNGDQPSSAAQSSGISLALVNRLAELGRQSFVY